MTPLRQYQAERSPVIDSSMLISPAWQFAATHSLNDVNFSPVSYHACGHMSPGGCITQPGFIVEQGTFCCLLGKKPLCEAYR